MPNFDIFLQLQSSLMLKRSFSQRKFAKKLFFVYGNGILKSWPKKKCVAAGSIDQATKEKPELQQSTF